MNSSAVDKAYEWLRENIVRGTLATGSFIDEAKVAEATGVSRTPVREAFHRLAGEQYIKLIPRRGAQVRELGAKEMYEVFSARYAIEAFALEELCQRKAPVPAEMEAALTAMENFPELDGPEERVAYGRLDIEFHRSYVKAIDNELILRMYDSLRPMHERSSLMQANVAIDDLRTITTEQHKAIMNGLRNSDFAAASIPLKAHLSPIPEVRLNLNE